MRRLVRRLLVVAHRSADRPAYPAFVGAVATADYLLPAAPTNAVLVASVLPRPQRWARLGVAFALGDALGALLVATAVAVVGDAALAWMGVESSALWMRVSDWADVYGLLLLMGLAILALPARVATMVFAVTDTTPLLIFAVVLAGRLVAYPTLAYVAARAPERLRWLRRPARRRPRAAGA